MNLIVIESLLSLLTDLVIGTGALLVFIYVKFKIDILMYHLIL